MNPAVLNVTNCPSFEPQQQQNQQQQTLKRKRTRFTPLQVRILEEEFLKTPYIGSEERAKLGRRLCLTDHSVKIWFKNRRRKHLQAIKIRDGFEEVNPDQEDGNEDSSPDRTVVMPSQIEPQREKTRVQILNEG
ncbi:homeobox protein DLX-4-like [Ceratitis capitata]|uniref:homeobox protein DLX-4-like n=1 Tax=Ceratitis capitata TaxID=7213 RepID=UPI000A0F8292|nr:homeobox protein DLX-4-like [Ceratitis capitata]